MAAAKLIRLCLAAALLLPAAPARAQTPALNLDEARGVTALMDKDRLMQRTAHACPADVYATLVSPPERVISPRDVADDYCAAFPGECYRLCAETRSPVHCFRLAQTFEANISVIKPRYKLALFTFACATGGKGGCTNRGAGLRNGYYDDDPLRRLSRKAKQSCEFRTFRTACGKDDPWGCAMLVQSHRVGEGTPRNATRARRSYEKSCALKPDFAACRFAKSDLEAMLKERGRRKKR